MALSPIHSSKTHIHHPFMSSIKKGGATYSIACLQVVQNTFVQLAHTPSS